MPFQVQAVTPDTSLPALPSANERIINGKVEIKKVEIRGEAIFPEYGVTNDYIRNRLNRSFSHMNAWMSVSDMHRLADDLTVAYHNRGLTFNQVYVIPQEIRGNTLILNVLAGRLSEIHIANNSLYTDEQIKAPFRHLIGSVVYEPSIQETMHEINRLPGLKVFGFFSMGRHQGETRLNLHVQQEVAHQSTVRIDNWGVKNTGETRVSYQYVSNNISGRADTLQASILSTDQSGNIDGGINYRIPLSPVHTVGGAFGTNQFAIGGPLSEFGLAGHLESLSGFWNANLLFQQSARADAFSSLALKQSRTTSDIFQDVFEESVDYITVQSRLQALVFDPHTRIRQALSITPQLGSISQTNNDSLDKLFYSVRINYDFQYGWRSTVLRNWKSRAAVETYLTSQKLPASERDSMTGANAVRGYKPALFSADQIYKLFLEQDVGQYKWRQSQWEPFAFIDYANGKQNDSQGNTASFLAAGIGVGWHYERNLTGNLTVGFPIQADSSADYLTQSDKPVIFGYISAEF